MLHNFDGNVGDWKCCLVSNNLVYFKHQIAQFQISLAESKTKEITWETENQIINYIGISN